MAGGNRVMNDQDFQRLREIVAYPNMVLSFQDAFEVVNIVRELKVQSARRGLGCYELL
jgi:hypothetical protein